MGAALIVTLIEMLLKYGPSTYLSIIKDLETNDPTPEQIKALFVEAPETYFKE